MKSKKTIILLVFIFVITLLPFLVISLIRSKTRKPETSLSVQNTLTPAPVANVVWDDPVGFTFSYPENLIIDKHDEDQDNYAHVEIKSLSTPGAVIVWAKDLPLDKKGKVITKINDWLNTETRFINSSALNSTLGGQSALKISNTADKSLIIATIYDDLLFYIEAVNSDQSLINVFNTVTDTFTFKPIGDEASSQTGSTDEFTSYDEEEVLE